MKIRRQGHSASSVGPILFPRHDEAKKNSHRRTSYALYITGIVFTGISLYTLASVYNHRFLLNKQNIFVALCVICKYEDDYIHEYIDYYTGLGFERLYLYDNSNEFTLGPLVRNNSHSHQVTLIHYPGERKQLPAYHDCIQRALKDSITWAAFFDVDEFLVLKQHQHIVQFIQEYGSRGGIAVNWILFGSNNETVYKPVPVTKRFQYRDPGVNEHVKSILRLADGPAFYNNPHHASYFAHPRSHSIDTNGTKVIGPYNVNGPADVVALYHYHKKSKEEFIRKRMRGRADLVVNLTESQRIVEANKEFTALEIMNNLRVFDDSAWNILKLHNLKYVVFD